jgi:RNA polymerase sigma-70 factor (ECF subfamily)
MRRERSDHGLQTSALVNEAYIRLVDYKRMQWQDRAQLEQRQNLAVSRAHW